MSDAILVKHHSHSSPTEVGDFLEMLAFLILTRFFDCSSTEIDDIITLLNRKTVYEENKKKIISPVKHIFKKSLKLKASDAENIIKLHNAVDKFSSLIPFMISSEDMNPVEVDWKSNMIDAPDSSRLRILFGLIIREIKDFWRAALMLTVLADKDGSVDKTEVFKKVEEEILKLGLEKVWEVKPLINGRDVMKHLELRNGGPIVSEWQQKLIQWQLAYPCGNVQECIEWMMMQTQLKHLTT
ncbi:hypothetical protein L1987_22865 [Smallanthus sonchifolius]|uniref:Uncharacterized protein n=1 Tax=Smallanthus sonchifolius TaxID=185202 RepID=A0ACB9IFV4_9ASTR|nr:hypothetical protein L1987_22865 [Smallanthus sonchifolius]